jgi:hypothetical protein
MKGKWQLETEIQKLLPFQVMTRGISTQPTMKEYLARFTVGNDARRHIALDRSGEMLYVVVVVAAVAGDYGI